MLRNFLAISLCLHCGFITMLMLCPQGQKVGAVKGMGFTTVEYVEPKPVRHNSKAPNNSVKRAQVLSGSPSKATLQKESSLAQHQNKQQTLQNPQTLLKQTSSSSMGFDLQNLKSQLSPAMQKFFYSLRLEIERHKDYPKKAKRYRQTGEVAMRFAISKDGLIKDIQIERPSPFQTLNQSAKKTLAAIASKKYPLPAEITASEIQVVLPIRFTL